MPILEFSGFEEHVIIKLQDKLIEQLSEATGCTGYKGVFISKLERWEWDVI